MQQTVFDAQQLPAHMLMPVVFARAQPILTACRVAAAKGDQPGAPDHSLQSESGA